MMKKGLAIIILSANLFSVGPALADFEPRYRVGLEAQRARLNGDSALGKKTVSAGSVLVGIKVHENLGFETGYTLFSKANYVARATESGFARGQMIYLKPQNVYIDALGYLPLSHWLNLNVSLGIGQLRPGLRIPVAPPPAVQTSGGPYFRHKTGYRVGAGAEINFGDHWIARVMGRYQASTHLIRSVVSGGLGVIYQF